MRRTQWAVFTSMNPRPSGWRAFYAPASAPAADEKPLVDEVSQDVRQDGAVVQETEPVRFG